MRLEVFDFRDLAGIALSEVNGEEVVCDPSGALYLPSLSALVVSDLHLEKGSSFARRGQLVPPYDTAVTLKVLGAVVARYQPRIVISLGDSFHDREASGRLPALFVDQLCQLMRGREWFWITGNHDPDRPQELPGECVNELFISSLILRHEPSRLYARGEIAGHLHPAARIVQRGRSVRRSCFATDGNRMIMPAFGAYTGALNVLDRAFYGLFNDTTLRAFMLGKDRVYPIARSALR